VSLVRFAYLSVTVALATMAIKSVAFLLTHSVGLLSDALESIVNLTAALVAVRVLNEIAKPPDKEHAFGHGKAEYFSSLFEGILIGVASISIVYTAIQRLLDPEHIQQVSLGLTLALVASIFNFYVARLLIRKGREHNSITLEADGQHLMSDVWTSLGVIAGVGAASITGWQILDPIIAMIVASKIGWTGIRLTQRSIHGLMDASLPEIQIQKINEIMDHYREQDIRFHALKTRQAGAHSFISMHVITPGSWSIREGHDLLESIEKDIQKAIPLANVFTHIEPLEDPRSWDDQSSVSDNNVDDSSDKIKSMV
ncbi:MAG: cation diffusion facilitator family transporter, partial [Planctomycetota bacterium]